MHTTSIQVTIDLFGQHLTTNSFSKLASWQLQEVKSNGYSLVMRFMTTEQLVDVLEVHRVFKLFEETNGVFVQDIQLLGESIQVKENGYETEKT